MYRMLIENLIAPKPKRLSAEEHQEYTELLIAKDAELKEVLEVAREQGKIQEEIERVKEEVHKQDEAIKKMTNSFKEAESLLVRRNK